MDDIDHELLSILRADARVSVLALAKKMRLSRSTIQNRIDKLEQANIILGYTVKLKPESEPHKLRAMMNIALEGNSAQQVQSALRGLPQVHTLYTTNGRWDLIAEIRADNLEIFNQVLGKIRLIPGISASETNLLLSILKL
jgi:DNA-binding Lrp family transcriptional regulator